ncbi:MAG TPA: carboxypeptidase-like regulatory domain-containing protein [Hymenobacter sp.]
MTSPKVVLLLIVNGIFTRLAHAQAPAPLRGQVVDAATGRPLPYASVGVLHRPVGTVADGEGHFSLAVPGQYEADSLRISLVGYRAYSVLVGQFRRRGCAAETACPVALKANTELAEVVVRPKGRAVRRVLGNTVATPGAAQAFPSNVLGNQVGQRIRTKYPAMLEQVSFKIGRCSYDSLFYRVNVYQLGVDGLPDERRNLLPEAVYVSVAKAQTAERIRTDLSRYQIWLVPGQEVALCLELVRDLGPGKLWLAATFPYGGPAFDKDAGVGSEWNRVGAFGAAFNATVTEIRP